MVRHVVALIGSWPASRGAVADAIDIAQAERARLTLVARYEEPSAWLSLALLGGLWVDRDEVRRDAQTEAQAALEAALATVPADLPVTTRIASSEGCAALAADRSELVLDGAQPAPVGGPWRRHSLRGSGLPAT